MVQQSRREFLENSMFAATAAAFAGLGSPSFAEDATPAPSRAAGPNDVLRLAVLGVNGRGGEHLAGFGALKECEIVAICDPDEAVGHKKGVEVVKGRSGKEPKFFTDLRKVMEDPNIDAVSIATPNHWHSLGAIWALQAGKHVYVEKPVSHNVSEGRRAVEAARKYNKICQAGTQSRSNPGTIELINFIHGGGIGEVKLGRALCYKPRGSIGPRGQYKPPESVDYDIWCGPAPLAELTRPKLHYDWHWQWDCGNGDLGNQGIHQMDLARWGLGVTDLGRGVSSYGGRFGYEDAGDTPNTEISVFDFGDKTLIFEVRGLSTSDLQGVKVGNIFYGSEGYAVMSSYSGGSVFNLKGEKVKDFKGNADHFANFLRAVRTGKSSDLNADIEEGHLSSALCHLGNISYRLGELASVNDVKTRLESQKEKESSLETFDRTCAHLRDNSVDLDKHKIKLGASLAFDSRTESFVGPRSDEANPLLTREYRKGYEVPTAGNV